jgi:hypothetical protein
METASNDAIELQGQHGQQQVNKVNMKTFTPKKQPKQKPVTSQPCFRCEGDHKPDKCKHINAVCQFCSIQGHIEKACLRKRREKRLDGKKTSRGRKVHVTKIGAG